jgi:hypothetical protein
MSVSDRIQESTRRVEAMTLEALRGIEKALDNAERQNLRVLELRGDCPRVLAALGRLGAGLIPMDQGEVAIAQALVLDVSNGVSEDLGFGHQADAKQISTQMVTVAERSTISAMQSAGRGAIDHAVAFQVQ